MALAHRKLRLEIQLLERSLEKREFSEWTRPTTIIPAITVLVAITGIFIQGLTFKNTFDDFLVTKRRELDTRDAELKFKDADVSRKLAELRIQQLQSELTLKQIDLESLTRSSAEEKKQLDSTRLQLVAASKELDDITAKCKTAKGELLALAQKNLLPKEVVDKINGLPEHHESYQERYFDMRSGNRIFLRPFTE
jgi:hypothetical protein